MAIDYTNLFTKIGKLVKVTNAFLAEQSTIVGYANETLTQFEDARSLVPNMQNAFGGWQTSIAGWQSTLKQACDATLGTLQKELAAPTSSVSDILAALGPRMVVDSQTIKKSVVSAPSVSAGGSNVGNGALKATAVGSSGVLDERVIAEVVTLSCVRDRYSGGVAGAEQFSVNGYPKQDANSYLTRGNGAGQPVSTIDSVTQMLTNGSFGTIGSGTLTGWTYAAGAARISQETVNIHAGAGALKLSGDGSATTVTLTQALTSLPKQNSVTVSGAWLRKSGTVTGGSNLKVWLTGTGMSDVVIYNADPNGLTTSYALSSAFFNLAAVVPPDLTMNISWTSANSAGASAVLLIDNLVVAAPYQFGHVYYAPFRGSADFQMFDTFAVTNANDYAGLFQTYFGRFYDVALPSASSPSVSDSLAS